MVACSMLCRCVFECNRVTQILLGGLCIRFLWWHISFNEFWITWLRFFMCYSWGDSDGLLFLYLLPRLVFEWDDSALRVRN